jgi:putative tricarboxylic transport membrane protein
MIGTVAAISALVMIFKPDPEPEWPASRAWKNMAIAVAVLALYSIFLKPLGFILPTAFAAGIVSYQISPRTLPALFSGVGLSLGLFVLFKFLLGLGNIVAYRIPTPRKTVGSNFSSYSICGALTWIFLLISRLVLALHYHLTR